MSSRLMKRLKHSSISPIGVSNNQSINQLEFGMVFTFWQTIKFTEKNTHFYRPPWSLDGDFYWFRQHHPIKIQRMYPHRQSLKSVFLLQPNVMPFLFPNWKQFLLRVFVINFPDWKNYKSATKNVKFKSYNSSTIAQKVCMLLCVNQNHNFFKAVTWLTSCDVQNCWSKQPTEKNETIIDMSAHNIYICLECPYRSTNVYVV